MLSLMVNALFVSWLVKLSHSLPTEAKIPTSCQQMEWIFNQNNLTEAHFSPNFITGSGLSVCESSETCCTPSAETLLLKLMSRDFRDALRVASVSFSDTFAQAVKDIENMLLDDIGESTSQTISMFAQLSDGSALDFARVPIGDLFAQVAAYATTSNTSIDIFKSISEFFDELFIRMHGRGSPDFIQCLLKSQAELRPYGEIPRRLALSLSRNLEAFRGLLVSLRLAAEVLAESVNADLNNECAVALLRATACAQCRGYGAVVRTCMGLCANVARGCLAHVADVDQPWNELLESMEKTVTFLLGGRSETPDILASIESRLSEAVLHALENAPMLEKKVKKICGDAAAASVNGDGANSGDVISDKVASGGGRAAGDLGARLRGLVPVIAAARGFFASLPDTVCSDKTNRFSGQTDTDCWNGQRLADYTKPIIGIGTGAQKYNPEVRVTRGDTDANFAQLSDKLRHTRQILQSKTVAVPEPDALLMADFGSGSGDSDTWDSDPDSSSRRGGEDAEDFSGSGDGGSTDDLDKTKRPHPGTEDNGLDFDEDSAPATTPKTSGKSAAALINTSVLAVSISIVVSILSIVSV